MVCESKSGCVCSLIIYTGKGTLFDKDFKEFCISSFFTGRFDTNEISSENRISRNYR